MRALCRALVWVSTVVVGPVLVLALLAGCASRTGWTKPGASALDATLARDGCELNVKVDPYAGPLEVIVILWLDEVEFFRCMETRGWTR
jgi:hypothetical protein